MVARAGVILLAAGRSQRMGGGRNKVLLPLAGRPLLAHSLETLATCPAVESLVLVTQPEEREEMLALLASFPKPWTWAPGGEERQDSVAQGLQRLPPSVSLVAVHDGARPLASCALFCRVIEAAAQHGAALAAVPVTDTLKEVEGEALGGWVRSTLDRSRIWQAQTPQAFRRALLEEAHRRSQQEGYRGTDDASLVERLGLSVRVVLGEVGNVKVTHPQDLLWAEALYGSSRKVEQRVGYGYDIHPFSPGRALWLGGVQVPYCEGLQGHSDADVVLHALCDALLGAAALGDIGTHFPNTDPAYRNISSLILLERTWAMVRKEGWNLSNADIMILAQRPPLAPLLPAMRQTIARALGCLEEQVNLKATTHEGLDAVGQGKAIVAQAVVHLWRSRTVDEREGSC